MKRMRLSDPTLPPGAQDKRGFRPIAAKVAAARLLGTPADASARVRPAPVEWFDAAAAPDTAADAGVQDRLS